MLWIKPYWGFEIRSNVCDFWRERPVKTRADTGRKHLAYPLWICQTCPCYDTKMSKEPVHAKSSVLCHRRRKLSHVMCWTSYTPRNFYPVRRLRKVLSNVEILKSPSWLSSTKTSNNGVLGTKLVDHPCNSHDWRYQKRELCSYATFTLGR